MAGSWRLVKVGLVAVLAILMIVLVAQNTDPIETRLAFVTVTMPRAALLLVTLLVGVVFGVAIASRILPARLPAERPAGEPTALDAPERVDAQQASLQRWADDGGSAPPQPEGVAESGQAH